MKWEEVKEGDLLQFRGTAPKKFKINMIRKEFANRATLLFSEINKNSEIEGAEDII